MVRMIRYILIILFTTFLSLNASAFSVIRDAETEKVVLSYVQKIFQAANLPPENAQIVLINDDSVNAFVAGGQTIFIHTGLITHAQNVDDLMFVLSHEIGHIVGGHVIRGQEQYAKIQTMSLITTLLGGLVAVASGEPGAGVALMMGGQSSAIGLFTAYRQTEESSADRIAMDLMQKTGYSAKGFLSIMDTIEKQERISAPEEGTYFKTHPVTRQRVTDLAHFTETTLPLTQDEQFDLIRAKLIGFLYPPKQVLQLYRGNTPADQYARAISAYQNNDIQSAIKQLDLLIQERPKNPYFHELKGQILFETGQIDDALKSYEQAYQLTTHEPLINLAYAHVLLEKGNKSSVQKSIDLIKGVLLLHPDIAFGWQLLARAFDNQGKNALALYATAEQYMAQNKIEAAKSMAQKARDKGITDKTVNNRIDDILSMKKEQ